MQELLLKRNHLFLLHFFTNYCESQRMHMIVFCRSQAQISAPKNGILSEIFIGHSVCSWRTIYRTAPVITGNVRRSDGHWGTLQYRLRFLTLLWYFQYRLRFLTLLWYFQYRLRFLTLLWYFQYRLRFLTLLWYFQYRLRFLTLLWYFQYRLRFLTLLWYFQCRLRFLTLLWYFQYRLRFLS